MWLGVFLFHWDKAKESRYTKGSILTITYCFMVSMARDFLYEGCIW